MTIYQALEQSFYEDAIGVFLTGFSVSLLLPAILIFLGCVLFLGYPKAFGIVYLFWQPQLTRQLSIGMGMGAVIWQTFLAGYLFEPMATNFTQDRPPFCQIQPTEDYKHGQYDCKRNRYQVASIATIFRYMGAVVRGAIILAPLVVLVMGAWYLLFHFRRGASSSRPSQPSHVKSLRGYRGGGLYVGALLGFFLLAGLTSTLLHTSWGSELVTHLGSTMVGSAGWGKAAARREFVARRIAGTLETGEASKSKTAKEYYYKHQARFTDWLRPYFPIFGLFVVNAGVVILVYLFWLAAPHFRRGFLPASGIMVFLQALLLAHVFVNYFFAAPHLILVLVVILILLAGVQYKLRFPGLAYTNPRKLEEFYQEQDNVELLPSDSIDFRKAGVLVGNQRSSGEEPPKRPLAIVCVSGGGSRATAWTMRLLTDLEQEFAKHGVAFPYHVRLITGASGGMIAGCYYAAGLLPPGEGGKVMRASPIPKPEAGVPITPLVLPQTSEWSEYDHLNNNVRQDFLTPIARAMMLPDLPSVFLPFRFSFDRGQALEYAWRVYLHGVMDKTFEALRPGEEAGWRPSLICSPMTVEDGRQLLISNLDLMRETENRANSLRPGSATTNLLSREGCELFKLFPNARNTFTVGTAARMSASFPFVMPAVELPTDPPLRVVDAGYYDNFGVSCAATWLFNNLRWVKENCSGVVLIQIRDGMTGSVRLRKETPEDADRSWALRGLDWLTAPPVGLYNMRTYATGFRNDTLLHLVNDLFTHHQLFANDPPGDQFFQTAEFEFSGGTEVQLNFTLTVEECRRIDQAADEPGIRDRIQSLLEWWMPRMPRAGVSSASESGNS